MFIINPDKSIFVTRGDIGSIVLRGKPKENGESYQFKVGDVVRLQICERNNYNNVVRRKELTVGDNAAAVAIQLSSEDTKIGEVINKPVDYWYEIELNPETACQTLIGHDVEGPKIFRLYPEGADR